MFKKIVILVVILVLVAIGLVLLRGDEDTWLCQNGQWVKHGNPSATMPQEPCGDQPQEEAEVIVVTPAVNEKISSPLQITGKAKGVWFFEGVFPAKLLDEQGNELAVGYVQSLEDWMSEDYVSFSGELSFISDKEQSGVLVLAKDNPSGLPEFDKEFRVAVQLSKTDTMTVKAYFLNNNLDPEISCSKVFEVERTIAKTQGVAKAALEELIKGPTQEEGSAGYSSSINPGTKIQSIVIEDKIAKVDFNDVLDWQIGGSCQVTAIRSQIEETLKQFSTIESVIISVNGNTEEVLQP